MSLARATLLAVLFLLAQHGSLRHELSHSDAVIHAEDSMQSHDSDSSCELCHAFAAVGGLAVWSMPALAVLGDLAFEAPASRRIENLNTSLPSPRSRGPPSLA